MEKPIQFKNIEEYYNFIDSKIFDLKETGNAVTEVRTKISELEEIDKNKILLELDCLNIRIQNGCFPEYLPENYFENFDTFYIEKRIEKFKLNALLSGEFDMSNAYIEIHSGAGGTESNDWANMLFRMYTRYFEKNDYSYEIINQQDGEEVGIKGVTMLVKGYYPFGYLKGETGVHRLVRISPFDSNSRRHTSFASVLVTPEINKNLDVEIKESDLRIDVYRSSGCGGQGVNTTDSAVRITHIPTGIVTSSQVERSQLRNKEIALEMLKNKLYILQQKEFADKIKDLKGDVMDVNFGSAIRSYVMCPYTLVKDSRSNFETSNVEKVLDGDIQDFLEEYLKI